MDPVTLHTERLVLRPFTPHDAEAVRAACQDPEISRWTPVPSPYTAEDARAWVGTVVPGGWAGDTEYNFAVCLRDGGTLVGAMGLLRLASLRGPRRQAEFGYWTVREHRRRGHTAEAGREICRWAFEDLGVERLEWVADAGNHASRAVARRIGFVMEGTMRSHIVHRGTRRDAWLGSLLPSDLGLPQRTAYLPYEEKSAV
ncbi:GNAT family N-acetyltransferase [Streptantibioticus silvisoli]|uniref:GNAT family N-acetyltransferase n=1 Tax=Streptantibioticus silvisoli TaxID=2705255 RepID=A0ABT6W911_9ACTN|nr:GNAT family N-acetyltransferase [Streptantibioticus silvisoli]MDI5965961.1 GNAT family N-acetyltransferase [Streptantibioticus silvisoli]